MIRILLALYFGGLYGNLTSALCVNGTLYLQKVRRLTEEQIKSSSWKHTEMCEAVTRDITRQPERGFIMQTVIQELVTLTNASIERLQGSPSDSDLFRSVVGDLCRRPVQCPQDVTNSPYRTCDGSCNNLKHCDWGMAERAQLRHIRPAYSDGIGHPRMYGKDGALLPSTRLVSNVVHKPEVEDTKDGNATVMVMAYGQFLDHDLILTPVIKEANGSPIKCCPNIEPCRGPLEACFPISIPKDDAHFSPYNITCMDLVRSAPALCNTCNVCQRNQINMVTSYIDASNVYGSSNNAMKSLRSFKKGQLKTVRGLLPETSDGTKCSGKRPEKEHCFMAGDPRVNTVPNLSLLHTLFMKEHNRLAAMLAKLNTHWSDDKIFHETRKIIAAQQQLITYRDYLPIVLGPDIMQQYNLSINVTTGHEPSYDDAVDATVANSFGAAAFRFGHASVPNKQKSYSRCYCSNGAVNIEDTYHNPQFMHAKNLGIARWLVRGKATPTDGFFEAGIRDRLFPSPGHLSLDLAAVNIQRGRDHGIPPYNEWRHFCGFSRISQGEFNATGTAFQHHNINSSDALRKVYTHADDIDLFPGAMRETPLPGAQVGPTFACLIGREFQKLKFGDRFYFENPSAVDGPLTGFTEGQLLSLKRQRFARIVCVNSNTTKIQENVFRPPCSLSRNPMKPCSSHADIDLQPWEDYVDST